MYQAVTAATRGVTVRRGARAKFATWFMLGFAHNHVWLPHGMVAAAGGELPGTLAGVTMLVSAWLQWRFFRTARRRSVARQCTQYRPRSWLRFYVAATCGAALICFALSPTTIMFWQLFVALPASALAMVMSAAVVFRSRFRDPARRIAGVQCSSICMPGHSA